MSPRLDAITDPWELLEELSFYLQMRVRAVNYGRFIALVAQHPTAQRYMLSYEAR